MTERRNGTYGAVEYSYQTCTILNKWIEIWNIPNPTHQDHFHSTIIYSRVPIPVEKQRNIDEVELKSLGWKFLPKSFKLFKSSAISEVKDVLVLILEAPELVNLHNELVEGGVTHDFETYEPHITLSYHVEAGFDWQGLKIPPVYFIPSKIYFEPLDVNWKE